MANILLEISSRMGPGGLASLQAGINMVVSMGRVIVDTITDLDKFSLAFRRNEIAIDELERRTYGMIDTLEELYQAGKLAEAGVKVTEEQLAILGVAAVNFAKSTGEDATQAFVRLTDSIAKGSTRALKEFGVDLENTEDLVLAQQEAVQKLTEKFGGMTTKIETSTEAMFALQNNVGTLAGLLWDKLQPAADDGESALGLLTEAIGKFNAVLSDESISAFNEYSYTLDWWIHNIQSLAIDFIGFIEGLTAKVGFELDLGAEEMRKRLEEERNRIVELFQQRERGTGRVLSQAELAQRKTGGIKPAAQTTGLGRRGKSRQKTTVGSDFGALMSGRVDEKLEMIQMADEANREWLANERMAEEERLEASREYLQRLSQLHEQHTQEIIAMKRREEEAEMRKHQLLLTFNRNFFGSLSALMTLHSKKAFKIGKGSAIVNTIIATAEGAIQAYKAMAGIPYIGPALGVAAAAAVSTAGKVQVGVIRRQRYDGGAGASATGLSGLGAVSFGPAAAGYSYGAAGGRDTRTVQVNISLHGGTDKIFEAVEEENDRRSQTGERAFQLQENAA